MAQFCRYCDHITVGGLPFCEIRERFYSIEHLRHSNECEHYLYNPIDALREHKPGHRPRATQVEDMPEQVPGQTTIYDVLKEE